MVVRARTAVDRFLDPLLAALFFATGVLEIWVEHGQVAGPRGTNTALLLVVTVPLAWRRRRPVAVLATVSAGAIAWNYALYLPGDDQPPLTPFLAVLLAVFTAAATSPRGSRAVALIAGVWILSEIPALAAGGQAAGNIVPAWIFTAFAWALGRVVYRQRVLATALAERASQRAVALERARIARELHDVVTHNVSVMVVQAGVERRTLGDRTGSVRDTLTTIEEIGRDTLVELRRLLGVLRKSDDDVVLAPQPTLERLGDLADQVGEAGLTVVVRVDGARAPLPAGLELSAYRIVQEALTNALKHAGAAQAEVTIAYGPDELVVEVTDDGRGASNGSTPGHGLLGMRERVAPHHGVLDAGGRDGGGFCVRARLPLDPAGR